ncbi:MAG: hypothetical protein JST55_14680 [Bacteroidetes bacterium]|nr:hypothetical protein [Bacteroidota bacterium]
MKIVFVTILLLLSSILSSDATAQYFEFYPDASGEQYIENNLIFHDIIQRDIDLIKINHVKKLTIFYKEKIHKEIFFNRTGNFDSIRSIFYNSIPEHTCIQTVTSSGIEITNIFKGEISERMVIQHDSTMTTINFYNHGKLWERYIYKDRDFTKSNKREYELCPLWKNDTDKWIRNITFDSTRNVYNIEYLPENDLKNIFVSNSMITEAIRKDVIFHHIENNRLISFSFSDQFTQYLYQENGLISEKIEQYWGNCDKYNYFYEYYDN